MTTSTFSRLSNYLVNNDWKIVKSFGDKLQFLGHKDEERILEIYDDKVPGSEKYFQEAITFLAERENKSKSSLANLFCSEQGVMQIRVTNKTGEIDIETSLNLRNTAKKMITATSNSSIERKLVHLGTKDLAIEKLKECKEIPTKEGSYIVTIIIPEETGILDLTQQALKTTSKIVSTYSIPTAVKHDELAEKGVSSNFLNSFEPLTNIAEKDGVEISFSSGTEVLEYKINKDFCDFVKELSESFTSEDKEKIVEVIGIVKSLGWNERDGIGNIKLNGTMSGSKQKLDFILQTNNKDFYIIARGAEFPTKNKIKVKGTLIPGTKRISDITELFLI